MARLPTLDDLGARPVPVSRRSVVSNPRAGAVGDALAGFGNQLQQTGGRMLREQREKEDRLAYASARSALLRADIETRKELENDPDYETWEQRYSERMSDALGEAGKLIGSSADRALFEQDARVDILRGSADLAKGAHARRVDAEVATGRERLFELQDLAQDAIDDGAREAVIGTASELISGLQAKGYISATDAVAMRREWTQSYVVQRIETLRNAEDYDGALKFFDANRGRLDQATESRIENLLTDATNNREALILAEEFVHGTPATGEVSASPAPPVAGISMSAMIAITAQSESGNRERDSRGRLITSHAGAQGRMQVMPATARDPGHGIRPWDGKTDADRSRVGEELLAALMRKYGNDPAKAWAAYNWGERRVDAAVRKHGAEWLSHAPAETRNYVRKNVAALGTGGPSGDGQPVLRHDLRQINTSIDERAEAEGWSPEKTERVKAQAARLVSRDDALLDREQADAYEAALAKAETLGENFTDPSQLGDAYYRASETQQATLRNIAEANVRAATAATAPKANGDVVRSLHRMAIEAPGEFTGLNLAPYRPFMTPGEFDEISTSQAKARENAGKWSPRTGIQTAITWGEKFGGVELDNDTHRYRVYRYMEDRARQFRVESKGREPAESDYQRWFREAAAPVSVTRSFFGIDALAPDITRRSFEGLSPNFRAQIIRNFKAVNGREPNEAEIRQWFERMGEAIR